MQEIVVKVDMEAKVTVTAGGVQGAGCQALTAALEAAIGKTVTDIKTPQYFAKEQALVLVHEISVDPAGVLRFVWADELVDLVDLGASEIRRASYVEPSAAGGWTADLGPVGGPALGPFRLRGEALRAETAWLRISVAIPLLLPTTTLRRNRGSSAPITGCNGGAQVPDNEVLVATQPPVTVKRNIRPRREPGVG